MRNRLSALFPTALALGAAIAGCSLISGDGLRRIRDSGRLTLITDNNAHCYYIYRETPMGFEYDLARAFADSLGVELDVVLPGWDGMLDALSAGEGDLVAASLTATPARRQLVDFSDAYLRIQQYVITHRNDYDIRSIRDLGGRQVHVREGTSYHERLLELNEEGLGVELILHKNVPTEELIRQVADGEIDITVADTNFALLNRRYYPSIRIAFPISEMQSLAWAVRKGDSKLLASVNRFLAASRNDGTFGRIYQKYYANVETFDYFDLRKFHRRTEKRLPKYEDIIRTEAAKYGFEWPLVAAMVYQESHFDPESRSHAGAVGLMQLTERAAQEMGVEDLVDPEQSVRGGVKYLHTLYERFDHVEGLDRMFFALASYNIGYGHVMDALEIARQRGLDTSRWSSLKQTLPLLRYRKHYEKARYGYARGTEPVRYVDRILTYYDILKRKSLGDTLYFATELAEASADP